MQHAAFQVGHIACYRAAIPAEAPAAHWFSTAQVMAPRNTERSQAVKMLRAIASRAGVERVSDNASRARVTAMYEATLAAHDLTRQERAGLLRKMCGAGAPFPRFVFSDRGPGFYQASHGTIVEAYHAALQANKLQAFAGADASWQPPDLADLLMHETVAAWVRKYFITHPMLKGPDLEKNWHSFEKGMLDSEAHNNAHHDLSGLCVSLPRRLQKLRDNKGDRLHD